MSKKTYVITVSTVFPKTHPKAGQPTNFVQQIIDTFHPNKPPGKIHTIRENFEYWSKVAEEVNSGRAVLSLRTWSGVPYNSKQNEFAELSSFGIQRVKLWITYEKAEVYNLDSVICNATPLVEEVAKNDGLDVNDFDSWFFPKPKKENFKEAAILHFTDFRYK